MQQHRPKARVDQLGLFRSTVPSPQWKKLPSDAREEVIQLLVELLRGASAEKDQERAETAEANDE
jgi:predicted Fe-S protein YdhL (DUF1289 family)